MKRKVEKKLALMNSDSPFSEKESQEVDEEYLWGVLSAGGNIAGVGGYWITRFENIYLYVRPRRFGAGSRLAIEYISGRLAARKVAGLQSVSASSTSQS